MPQKSYHDFKEKYTYVHVGKVVSIPITDIFTKNSCFLSLGRNTKKTNNGIRFSKMLKVFIVVDKLLHSLRTKFEISEGRR